MYGQEEYGVSLSSVPLVQVSPLGDNGVCKAADCTTEMTQSQSPSGPSRSSNSCSHAAKAQCTSLPISMTDTSLCETTDFE